MHKKKEDLPDELMGDGEVHRLEAKEYMDAYVNPESFVEAQRKAKGRAGETGTFSRASERVSLFLMREAPLTRWQRNIIGIIRDEAYYFAPQAMTKIMNEGWASYCTLIL